mgnify:FL=1|jgi:hypothetical protein
MKKSELRKIVIEYKEIKIKLSKSSDKKLKEELKQYEHRYYHETGRTLKSDLGEIT